MMNYGGRTLFDFFYKTWSLKLQKDSGTIRDSTLAQDNKSQIERDHY